MKVFTVMRNECNIDEYCGMAVVAKDAEEALRLVKQNITDNYIQSTFADAVGFFKYNIFNDDGTLTDEARKLFETVPVPRFKFRRERRDNALALFAPELVTITEVDVSKPGVFMIDYLYC